MGQAILKNCINFAFNIPKRFKVYFQNLFTKTLKSKLCHLKQKKSRCTKCSRDTKIKLLPSVGN